MEILFKILLGIHITGGTLGLLAGTVSMVRKKGDKLHRSIGNVFLFGMLAAGATSLALSIIHPNYFLLITGVFTLYMASTGRRYLYLKKSGSPQPIDWALTGLMFIAAMVFVICGSFKVSAGDNFGFVFIAFGVIGMRFVKADRSNYTGRSKIKNYWLTGHLQRMTGCYIAALTAFLAVNGAVITQWIPNYVLWLLPTFILVPLIVVWTKKYKVKV
ncbi:MAG TPA: hypothetical protein VI112_14985 [Bacteroidia bacterium]